MGINQENNREQLYLLGLISFSILWALIVLWPHLIDPYRVPIDVQNHYWMAKFQDPSLFENDVLTYADDLIEAQVIGFPLLLYPRSLGYGLIFWAGSFLISPLWLGKIMVFFLLPVSVYYVYQLGKNIRNPETGFLAAALFLIFNLASPDSLSVASGLQRSFAFPVYILFLHFLHKRHYWKSCFVIVMGALIYLPTVPIMVITYGLTQWWEQKMEEDGASVWIPFTIACLISMALALWAIAFTFDFSTTLMSSEQLQRASIFTDPRYQSGGAAPMYLRAPWIGRAGLFESYPEAVILLVMVSLIAVFNPSNNNILFDQGPAILKNLVIAGGVMFFLSLITLGLFSSPYLYMPSRYVRYPLFLISIYILSTGQEQKFQVLKKHFSKLRKGKGVFFLFAVLAVIFLFIGIVFGFQFPDWLGWFFIVLGGVILCGNLLVIVHFMLRANWPSWKFAELVSKRHIFISIYIVLSLVGVVYFSRFVGFGTINPTEEERDLYEYVRTLHEDVLLAGSPEELTGMPLFAKRRVLLRDLRPRRDAPIVENFQAYYASNRTVVSQFCNQYDVDYLVVHEEDFRSMDAGQFFYEPYNTEIKNTINMRPPFAVLNMEKVFSSGPISLIQCD